MNRLFTCLGISAAVIGAAGSAAAHRTMLLPMGEAGIQKQSARVEAPSRVTPMPLKSPKMKAGVNRAQEILVENFENVPEGATAMTGNIGEKYTDLRCGWCPGGYVTLAEMTEKYGHEEFVAMAYHSSSFENGAMVCFDRFPYSPSGYPASQINRRGNTDVLKIPEVWASLRNNVPDCELSVSLEFDGEESKTLKAQSQTRFIRDIDDVDYAIAFALVADGLYDPNWAQYNAYALDADKYADKTGPWWDLFIGKGMDVYGLTFDDVAVYFPNMHGIEGSLPPELTKSTPYEHTFEVNTDDVVNVVGEHIVKDFGKTRVIAMEIDRKNRVPRQLSLLSLPHERERGSDYR